VIVNIAKEKVIMTFAAKNLVLQESHATKQITKILIKLQYSFVTIYDFSV